MLSSLATLLCTTSLILGIPGPPGLQDETVDDGDRRSAERPADPAGSERRPQPDAVDEGEPGGRPEIGDVEIVAHDVWDTGIPDLVPPLRLASRAHVRTRNHVVRRELLFRTGERLDLEDLAQTERNLRALPFLRDAQITILPRDDSASPDSNGPEADGEADAPEDPTELIDVAGARREGALGEADVVDLRVETWDAWSTSPEVRFSKVANRIVWTLGLSEKNFMGRGQHIEVSRRSGLDAADTFLFFRDPNLAGTRWRLSGTYSNRPSGSKSAVALERPFFAIDTDWAFSLRAERFDRDAFRYRGGELSERLRHVRKWQEVEVARSVVERPHSAVRLHAAVRQREDRVGGELRDYGIVEVGISSVEHRFVELRHVNRFEAAEDFNLGARSSAFLGISTPILGGGPERALFFSLAHRRGFRLGRNRFLFGRVAWTGRHQDGELQNSLLDAGIRYLDKLAERRLLLAVARLRYGTRLDPEVQLTVGSENGLRGFPVHQFVGDRSLSLTAEHRWFVADDVARLLSFGVSTFVDGGFAWPAGESIALGDLRTDVGFGLLVGRNRLSSSQPGVRFDVAYALDPITNHGRWQFSTGSDIRF